MKAQEHEDIWIRWVPWKKTETWVSSIQGKELKKPGINKVLFILTHLRCCIFIPMEDMRSALAEKPPNKKSGIVFEINPRTRSVKGHPVKMDIVISTSYRNRLTEDTFKDF